jgi:indole-3-glycerol phosphate synthase
MYLSSIISDKRTEVAAIKAQTDMRRLQDQILDAPPPRQFEKSLKRIDGRVGLIAEIKKASPSAGLIQPNFDPVGQGKLYQSAGADCLSILTDTPYFQGQLDDLRAVRQVVDLPILRKDFTIDLFQIAEARAAGELIEFGEYAKSLGLASLLEVHTEDEMAIALEIGATLIGINSRNLKTFEVDLVVVEKVAAMVPKDSGITLVGESGIKTRADVDRLKSDGVHAILVGETLMRAENTEAAVRELVG